MTVRYGIASKNDAQSLRKYVFRAGCQCDHIRPGIRGLNTEKIAPAVVGHIGDVAAKHGDWLATSELESLRHARLCELNVIEQVSNVCQTTVVEDAWSRHQALSVHGWIYGLHDGRVRDLGIDVGAKSALADAYERALHTIGRRA